MLNKAISSRVFIISNVRQYSNKWIEIQEAYRETNKFKNYIYAKIFILKLKLHFHRAIAWFSTNLRNAVLYFKCKLKEMITSGHHNSSCRWNLIVLFLPIEKLHVVKSCLVIIYSFVGKNSWLSNYGETALLSTVAFILCTTSNFSICWPYDCQKMWNSCGVFSFWLHKMDTLMWHLHIRS